MFIPSLAVVSHYFRRKRTLVMTFVVAGSSLGAIIHPIMLNNLLNGPVGFANGVRASAGLISGLLLIACLCMRTRLDPPTTPVNYFVAAKKCLRDVPFVFMIAGWDKTSQLLVSIFELSILQGLLLQCRLLLPIVLFPTGLYPAWNQRLLFILLCEIQHYANNFACWQNH